MTTTAIAIAIGMTMGGTNQSFMAQRPTTPIPAPSSSVVLRDARRSLACRNANYKTAALPNLNALVFRLFFDERCAPRSCFHIIFALKELYGLNPFAADEKTPIGHHRNLRKLSDCSAFTQSFAHRQTPASQTTLCAWRRRGHVYMPPAEKRNCKKWPQIRIRSP
jgi:hypothetical protein